MDINTWAKTQKYSSLWMIGNCFFVGKEEARHASDAAEWNFVAAV
jgi:hypothetical protein